MDGKHKEPGAGPEDQYDPEGYDDTQRAEILEVEGDGPVDGVIETDIDPDLGGGDADDDDDEIEDDADALDDIEDTATQDADDEEADETDGEDADGEETDEDDDAEDDDAEDDDAFRSAKDFAGDDPADLNPASRDRIGNQGNEDDTNRQDMQNVT